MHGSVLQNKKYIEFSDNNTVEVISLSRLQEGIDKEDPKAATYAAKDENGNAVQYLLKYPGMTVAEMKALNSSPAGRYNDTGAIPYTVIINPHTLEKIQFWKGGQSTGTIMDAVTGAQRALGKSLKRSDLRKFNAELAKVEEVLADKGCAKAFSAFKKLEKLGAKIGPKLEARASAYRESTLLAAAAKELDTAETAIDDGDLRSAKKILGSLVRALKGTPLFERAVALKARTKPASDGE